MTKCAWCGQPIKSPRSIEISTRFHAHVTYVTRVLQGQRTRDEVYWLALLKAVEIEPPPGGSAYRYSIVDGIVRPVPTSGATNREMMTACLALEHLAFEWDLGPLPEREDLAKIAGEIEND